MTPIIVFRALLYTYILLGAITGFTWCYVLSDYEPAEDRPNIFQKLSFFVCWPIWLTIAIAFYIVAIRRQSKRNSEKKNRDRFLRRRS